MAWKALGTPNGQILEHRGLGQALILDASGLLLCEALIDPGQCLVETSRVNCILLLGRCPETHTFVGTGDLPWQIAASNPLFPCLSASLGLADRREHRLLNSGQVAQAGP